MRYLFLLPVILTAFMVQAQPAYFLSQPCISPDGQTVIFSFEGDLWQANVAEAKATRLTAMQGYETNARISPDGKWVAFTGRQFGNADIFIMPVNGGEIQQLTWHSADDEVTGWSWDSRSIYFNSNRYNRISGYKVNVTGGTPQKVFDGNYFQYDHNLVEHPDKSIFFNDTWESSNQLQRKRYKGPFNPEIQSYNFTTGQHKIYTHWEGKDFGATIDKNGNIYFISDEANGEYNLYVLKNNQKKALTGYTTSIKAPVVSANGTKVVFEKDYQLWLYDVATSKAALWPVNIIRNPVLPQQTDYEVKGNIESFDISPDGKKLAFVSRGELFVSDAEGKFVKQLNRNSGERVKEVKWLYDNRTLLFNQTKQGYPNWYTIAADAGSSTLKQLTNDAKSNRSVVLNAKKDKAVYLSGRNEVKLLDLKTFQSQTLATDEIWGFQNSNPGFSPNDEYVIFTAYRNFEQDIFIHHIKNKQTINLTNTGITESSPLWSGDGKYIYFTSQRLKPSYPFGMQNAKVYRLALERFDAPYVSDKLVELFADAKKDTAKNTSAKTDSIIITINTDKIMERMEQVSPSFGTQYLDYVHYKNNKTTALYYSNHEGSFAMWKTTHEPFEMPKTEKIAGTENSSNGGDIAKAADKFYMLHRSNIVKLNMDASKIEPVNISCTFRRNLSAEFSQMFEEAWAQMQENYYDEKFHDIHWEKIKKQYAAFVPHLNNRADLRVLLNDMLGELNSSHQGFNTTGSDETVSYTSTTMETGIVFDNNNPYKVQYILKRTAADKKGINIEPGDILTKVNDVAVDIKKDRNYYFTYPSRDREVTLTFERKGKPVEVKIHPQSGQMLNFNFYEAWIDENQKRVDEKSNNRIAYGYMKNMGQGELEQFIIDMTQELNGKEALILDLRYNTGGNVHDEVLKFLSQKTYLRWKYREGKLSPQSNFAPADKPIVLLINEQSLSDAEMTAQGFKALQLGKIIGNSTYRWIIFTSGISLVDGSLVRMPSWGCYSLEGDDLEMTGVSPDIRVINSFEDKLKGRDPQLDRAIEEILKQIK